VTSEKVTGRTNTKDIGAVAQYQVEMGRPYSKNGPTQMAISDINVGRNEATDGPRGRHVQEDSGHEEPKPGANGVHSHNIRKSDTSRKVHLVINTGALSSSTRRPHPSWD
jgi:hypothetical protein